MKDTLTNTEILINSLTQQRLAIEHTQKLQADAQWGPREPINQGWDMDLGTPQEQAVKRLESDLLTLRERR